MIYHFYLKEGRKIEWLNLIKQLDYIDMNTELKKRAKVTLGKIFSSWWKLQFFGNTMENMRKHRDIRIPQKKEETIWFQIIK